MDRIKFKEACERVVNSERSRNGIGTLGEKTLHAVLKDYFEPYEQNREIKIAGFVADIMGENGIIEIQTGQFNRLRNKLEKLLEVSRVTVVYPVPHIKWLVWIDEKTGKETKKRKSPRVGKPQEFFAEAYKIKHLLKNPNLSFCIVMVDIIEYRYLNGWSEDRKKGSERCDRVPCDISGEIYINSTEDYIKLIPFGLPERFSSKDYKKASGISLSVSQTALNILNFIGTVNRTGKQGNLILYTL